MGQKVKKQLNKKFIEEYRNFIENYLLRLLGIVEYKLENDIRELEFDRGSVILEGKSLLFSASGWNLFYTKCEQEVPEDNIKLANRVVESFFKMSEYKRTSLQRQNNFSNVQRDTIYNMAIQKGICSWIVNHSENENIEKLFYMLEKWAVKTYEGKNVTLGFIVNLTEKSKFDNRFGTWLTFMEDDSVAVLTDSIHSVIELDENCNYLRHLSISNIDKIDSCELNYRVPLRFMHIIQNYVKENKVGIFLLNNGDIILAKNQQVCFVKRNLQWLNFSYEAFYNALETFLGRYPLVEENLIKDVFASVLDISFSHTGGIISFVGEPWEESSQPDDFEKNVLHKCDNLLLNITCNELYQELIGEIGESELKKRLLKRNVILNLTNGKSFSKIDRKLRCELMSLDGACIISGNGLVQSFGAIIQNDSGSSGGGRGAAAKKLSAYGMAVKISTDGYIELYINRILKYAIK